MMQIKWQMLRKPLGTWVSKTNQGRLLGGVWNHLKHFLSISLSSFPIFGLKMTQTTENVFEKIHCYHKTLNTVNESNNWVAAMGSYGLLYSSNMSHPTWKIIIFWSSFFWEWAEKHQTPREVAKLQQILVGSRHRKLYHGWLLSPHQGTLPSKKQSSSPDPGKLQGAPVGAHSHATPESLEVWGMVWIQLVGRGCHPILRFPADTLRGFCFDQTSAPEVL